ncbi:hypothetical protein HHX47_DHR6000783 [Lentinula edodes]|nr:hypothetical protein HHX47_DHR6000783 [Lentinula edodes]
MLMGRCLCNTTATFPLQAFIKIPQPGLQKLQYNTLPAQAFIVRPTRQHQTKHPIPLNHCNQPTHLIPSGAFQQLISSHLSRVHNANLSQ